MQYLYENIPIMLKQRPNRVTWGIRGSPLKQPFNPASLLAGNPVPAKAGVKETWSSYQKNMRGNRYEIYFFIRRDSLWEYHNQQRSPAGQERSNRLYYERRFILFGYRVRGNSSCRNRKSCFRTRTNSLKENY